MRFAPRPRLPLSRTFCLSFSPLNRPERVDGQMSMPFLFPPISDSLRPYYIILNVDSCVSPFCFASLFDAINSRSIDVISFIHRRRPANRAIRLCLTGEAKQNKSNTFRGSERRCGIVVGAAVFGTFAYAVPKPERETIFDGAKTRNGAKTTADEREECRARISQTLAFESLKLKERPDEEKPTPNVKTKRKQARDRKRPLSEIYVYE